jgi:hypothetical protein
MEATSETAEAKAMRDLRDALVNAPLQKVTEPMTFHYEPASVRVKAHATLATAKERKPGLKLPFLEFIMNIDTVEKGERMAWNVAMTDMKVVGQPLNLSEPIGYAFTTDEHGLDIRDFQDNTKMGILSVADIESDFIIPEGAYKSGDVCMPVKMKNTTANLQYDFPEGTGFVFQGLKQVGSMRVAMFTAQIDHFTAGTKDKELVRHGTLSMVRYYDLANMMPLLYDGTVVLDMKEATMTTTGGMTRIQN